jgi:hypothetical protein
MGVDRFSTTRRDVTLRCDADDPELGLGPGLSASYREIYDFIECCSSASRRLVISDSISSLLRLTR